MLVELGNPDPIVKNKDPQGRPSVAYVNIPDTFTFKEDVDTEDWRNHLGQAVLRRNGITNYEGGEALCTLTHPNGLWPSLGNADPSWVWSDNPNMQRFLSEYYQCPEGRPAFVDETHWRMAGAQSFPPGVPFSTAPVTGLLTNVGVTSLAWNIAGGGVTPVTGTGTAATGTTLTTALTTTSTTQYTGARVYVMSASTGPIVWGNILSCTNGSSSVLTVDRWYNPSSPGGSAGSTPASGYYFVIADGGFPSAWFMGLTTTNISASISDTSLSGEYTSGNGMVRGIAAFAVTSAASGSGSGPPSITCTVSKTFTYSTSGALTFYAMALFTSMVVGTAGTMVFETSFSGSFTVTNNGDQATVTDTLTGS